MRTVNCPFAGILIGSGHVHVLRTSGVPVAPPIVTSEDGSATVL